MQTAIAEVVKFKQWPVSATEPTENTMGVSYSER